MTKQEAEALVNKHGGNKTAAAAAAGVSRASLRRLLDGEVKAKPIQKGRTLAEFREIHDKTYFVPQKVKKALAELGDGWMYESEFSKHAGVSTMDLGLCRDDFSGNWVQLKDGRRVWTGSRSTKKAIEETL
jgi:hypothetical protein